jgi:hypothetical protein
MLVDDCTLAAKGLIDGDAVVREPQQPASRRLRSSTGSRRMSSPFHLEEVERAEHRSGAGGMMANKTRSGGWIARRSGGSEAHAVNNPGCSVQLPSVWRRSPAPFVRCPGSRLEQSTFSNALLNAFWNAFSKFFRLAKAPICCVVATKRS